MKSPRQSMLAIGLIIATGTLFRLRHVTQPFTDAISWRQSSVAMIANNFAYNGWNIFYPEVSWSGPGPGYQGREFQTISYLAALLYTVIGHHDWIGRSVTIVFGALGLLALYQLVRRLWDVPHAIAAAAIMALLPGSIYFDRSFIPDPAMVALMLISFWLLVVHVQTERTRFLILAVLIGSWGALTKLTGLMLVVPMAYVAIVILYKRAILTSRRLIKVMIAAGIGLLFVVGYYLWAVHLATTYPPFHFAGEGHWLWNGRLGDWLQNMYFLDRLPQRVDIWLWTWPGALMALLGLLLIRPGRVGHAPVAPWFLHIWLLAGAIFYVVGAEELIGQPWNFHIISPAIAILAGHALVVVARAFGWSMQRVFPLARHISAGIPVLVCATVLAGLCWIGQERLTWLEYPYAQSSYELGVALESLSQPGDLVVTIADNVGDPIAIYYSGRRGWVFPPAGTNISVEQMPSDDATAVRLFDTLRAQGAIWFGVVRQHNTEIKDSLPKFARSVATNCRIVAQSNDWVIYRVRGVRHE